MKYIGTCIITDECLNRVTVTRHNNGFLGTDNNNNTFIYIPIKEGNNKETLFSKFEVNGIAETQRRNLLDSLCSATEDIIKKNIPLTSNQIASIKQIVESNPPKSAICIESTPIDSLVLAKYRSGDNYSIKLGDKLICDINGDSNASKVESIISSAFYTVIENILRQINAPK